MNIGKILKWASLGLGAIAFGVDALKDHYDEKAEKKEREELIQKCVDEHFKKNALKSGTEQ